ncbi:MAG: N-acetylmuramic acid 6-phosphate etherase [Verrucomicrobiota bacterium]
MKLLGIEGGGTRTVALFHDGQTTQRYVNGPGNLRLLTDAQWVAHLREIAGQFPCPDALGLGLAGARTPQDRARICALAAQVWPGVPCHAANDLETALATVEPGESSATVGTVTVLVLSGTGSCCYGRTRDGKEVKVGGWGHILGDRGSGYDIALQALKQVIATFDSQGQWPRLGARFLRHLNLNEPEQLIGWAQRAGKEDVAALALEVLTAASQKDPIATRILNDAAGILAGDAMTCARRIAWKNARARFVLTGGMLLKQPGLAMRVRTAIRKQMPLAIVEPLRQESVWGAVKLAEQALAESSPAPPAAASARTKAALPLLPVATGLSPTEERHPRSRHLDRMPLRAAIQLMASEDAQLPMAILAQAKPITQAIRLIIHALKHGGRLFYVGAGTSGRLGVLDASECPPTFRTAPEMVQGIIAGGQTALWESVEGAEDDLTAGARAITFRVVSQHDVVVGIAASGRTPFVWGALNEAKKCGAKTVLLAFNPHLHIPRTLKPTVCILPNTGPEVLTGSTRLKSGTATKMILNMLTTLSMVKLGKVVGNLMVDLNPSNTKLRDRAIRILCELQACPREQAQLALEQSGWIVKAALHKVCRREYAVRITD